jgi:hypothetical protein
MRTEGAYTVLHDSAMEYNIDLHCAGEDDTGHCDAGHFDSMVINYVR